MQIQSAADLGSLIRAERKRQGLRQADLAEIVGTSHVSLRQIEAGRPNTQLGRVLRVLDELGIRLTADAPSSDAIRAATSE